jgi:hypothetical protein
MDEVPVFGMAIAASTCGRTNQVGVGLSPYTSYTTVRTVPYTAVPKIKNNSFSHNQFEH